MSTIIEPSSQEEEILKYLQENGSITPIDALNNPSIRSFRLGARIFSLRQEGHDIKTTMISRGNKRYAQYSLVPSVNYQIVNGQMQFA